MQTVVIENPPPVEVLIERFGRRRLSFVLDSAQANDGLGEWSFFGAEPVQTLSGGLDSVRVALSAHLAEPHPFIPFTGGAVGYIAYDYGRQLEALPVLAIDDREIDAVHFAIYDGVAAFNHAENRLYLVAHGSESTAAARLTALKAIVDDAVESRSGAFSRGPWGWNLSEDAFREAVAQVRAFIASGDVYQVNLSRRARCQFSGDSVELYQSLRRGNPAPYGAYLDLGHWQLISTSPEQFLNKRGRSLETRPIKGTRPRGASAAEDLAQEAALRASEKDRAELLMIVDLERNDFGRVAEFGSVHVEGLYQLERYARVIHQTARVKAKLAQGKDVFDALEALFPGGSITGAPKIRSMEIIEALEPTRRGAYCGSIGYIGFDGDAEFNIAIRSLHLKDGYLDYQVGGGIVWDSEPEAELQETLDKARAIRETIDQLCPIS